MLCVKMQSVKKPETQLYQTKKMCLNLSIGCYSLNSNVDRRGNQEPNFGVIQMKLQTNGPFTALTRKILFLNGF